MTYTRYNHSPPLNAFIEDLYYLDGAASSFGVHVSQVVSYCLHVLENVCRLIG
jgi:hypothetical protein